MPSSVVADFKYEPKHARLTVKFTTGRVYQYFMVPVDVADALKQAFSKGTYFNRHIRDKYTFRDITIGQPRKRSAR